MIQMMLLSIPIVYTYQYQRCILLILIYTGNETCDVRPGEERLFAVNRLSRKKKDYPEVYSF